MATKAKGALRWQLFNRAWLMAALLMAPYFLKKFLIFSMFASCLASDYAL